MISELSKHIQAFVGDIVPEVMIWVWPYWKHMPSTKDSGTKNGGTEPYKSVAWGVGFT